MFEKIINKIFFKKVVFKIVVVLTFFLSLVCFGRMCSNYHNPYDYYPSKKYNNFIEFIDYNLESSVLSAEFSSFNYYKHLYQEAFIRQAQQKGVFSSVEGNKDVYKDYSIVYKDYLVWNIYSCDRDKLLDFESKYKENRGYEFWTVEPNDKISVDCEKAKSVPLAPESYYFVKYELWQYVVFSAVFLPMAIFILWLALRCIIISPILWIFKK